MKSIVLHALGCFVFVVAGCIGIPKGDRASLMRNPTSERHACVYAVDVASSSGTSWTLSQAEASAAIRKALVDSGYFSDVSESATGGVLPLRFHVALSPSSAETAVSFLLGLTLFTIPCWATHDLTLVAEVQGPDGGWRKFNFRGQCTEVGWLPLIPVALFMSTKDGARTLVADGVANFIGQMRDDGMLPLTAELGARHRRETVSAPN